MKLSHGVLLGVSLVLLTACSKGPSDSEVKAVLQAEVDKLANLTSFAGLDMKVELHKVTVHGCEEARTDVYRCDVEVDSTAPIVGRSVERTNIMLAKTGAGWIPAN